MTRRPLWAFLLAGLIFCGFASRVGAQGGAGIVKGIVTLGGRAAPDAVVSIEGIPRELRKTDSPASAARRVMDQRELQFIPRVLPVLVGTTVDFPNSDKTFHNVFSPSEATKFDLGLYPPGETRSMTFDKSGVVKILCNVHPNMEAYVVVKDHPYFAATDGRGRYQLSGIPVGQFRLAVWHPALGSRSVSFRLARPGEVLTLDFDLKK